MQEEGCYPGEPQPAVRVPASALRRRAVPVHGDLSLRQQQQLHHHQLQPQQPGEDQSTRAVILPSRSFTCPSMGASSGDCVTMFDSYGGLRGIIEIE